MTELSLQRGEAVRIRSGRRLLLVLRADSTCEIRIVKRGFAVRLARSLVVWWLRMHRWGAAAGRRYVRARREHAQARDLAQLDAHILKDIGLEPHRGGSLARRVHAYRLQEFLRVEAPYS